MGLETKLGLSVVAYELENKAGVGSILPTSDDRILHVIYIWNPPASVCAQYDPPFTCRHGFEVTEHMWSQVKGHI